MTIGETRKLEHEVEVKKIESLNNIYLFKYLSSQANPTFGDHDGRLLRQICLNVVRRKPNCEGLLFLSDIAFGSLLVLSARVLDVYRTVLDVLWFQSRLDLDGDALVCCVSY